MLANKIFACELCVIWRKPIAVCKVQCKSPSHRPAGLTNLDCFHGPWNYPFGMHKGMSICAEPCGMWNSSTYSVFASLAKNIWKTQKAMQINGILKLSCQAQSISKNNSDLNQGIWHLWSKFGDTSLNGWWARRSSWLPNTRMDTRTDTCNDNTRGPKLVQRCRQAQNWVNFDLEVKFDLDGQGQSPQER